MILPLFCLALIAGLYLAAGAMLLSAILRRRGEASRPMSRRLLWARRIIFGFALFGILLAADAFIEPYWLEVTHVRIASAKLAKGSRPIRIAQISDLHCDSKPRLEERLPGIIARERPDIIVFTGDALNSREGLTIFKRCMARLAAIAPTFAVLGNWDAKPSELFDGTGVRPLNQEVVAFRLSETEVRIGGASIGRLLSTLLLFQSAPPNALTIFLYHYPNGAEEAARAKVDLCLAGHTHGGQFVLPFYGGIARLAGFEEKYVAGLYRVEGAWLYVNRGIGMEGGKWPRVRFLARPEVTIFDIVPQD
jgi:predicted MPP superfamily phosphohydrolase